MRRKHLPLLVMTLVLAILLPAPAQADDGDENGRPLLVGLHVPWAVPQERLLSDGNLSQWKGEWPNVKVNALRLWDTRTSWAELQPRPGTSGYSWGMLDSNIANARKHGVRDITLVLAGTPAWAAKRYVTGSAYWLPSQSASPPREEEWQRYVSSVVTRYKGKVTSYEIWNEPNNPLFWQGSTQELVRLTRIAASTIHRVDPRALVIAPAPLITNASTLRQARSLWSMFSANSWMGVDIVGVHLYPEAGSRTKGFTALLSASKGILHAVDSPESLWVTEVSYVNPHLSPARQGRLVHDTVDYARGHADRLYWYAWSTRDAGYTPTILFQPGTPAAKALASGISDD